LSLISNRPKHWNEVIGQQPVQLTLAGAITRTIFLSRGYIFSGDTGVGKTTVAYLFAKLAMCVARDPFNCPGCPSCDTFSFDRLGRMNEHPEFTEIDAASRSGVEHARDLLDNLSQKAQVGKRRVVLIDEAHRLSKPAWDVFLKPLEENDTDVIFIFSTNDVDAIPPTILSRCLLQEFALVSREDITGLLMSIADRERLPYTLDGLVRVAELSHGRPRVAINFFQTVAVTGVVNPENCTRVLRDDLTSASMKILELLVTAAQYPQRAVECLAEAIRLADRIAQISTPRRLLDALFSTFSKAFCSETVVAYAFNDPELVTSLFLKWTKVQQIPVDALPLFLMELLELLPGRSAAIATPEKRGAVMCMARAVKPAPAPVQADSEPESELSMADLDVLIEGTN
jgi:DNA polymerase III subunit gamma/tau